jgi:hypothetical protein
MSDTVAQDRAPSSPTTAPSRPDADDWRPLESRLWWIVGGALCAVVVLIGLVAWRSGWRPVGDDAFLVMRARDVFGADPPLLSTASSGGASAELAYNHPGPIVQYLNAPFVALLGTSGAALGCAALNATALAAALVLVRRTARPALAAAMLAAVAGLVWSMGTEVLVDPWNPHIATLPLLCGVVGLWAAVNGTPAGVPIAVLGASVAAQTHLSMTVLGVLLIGVALAVAIVQLMRTTSQRRAWSVATGVAVGLGLLSILPPLLQQLAHGSDGNVSRLLRGSDFSESPTGLGRVARLTAEVLAAPPWFLRGSWTGSIYEDELLAPVTAAVLLIVVAAVVVTTLVLASRRRDVQVGSLVAICVVGLGVGVAVATRFPLRTGVPVPYFRWLWVLAALLAAGLLARPVEWLVDRVRPPQHASVRPVVAVWLVLATVATVGTLVPYGEASAGSPDWAQTMADALIDQAGPAFDDLAPGDSVRVEASLQEASLIVLPSIIEELTRRDVDVTMTDPVLVQQSGEFRRSDGDEDWVLVPVGPDTANGPTGGERIAEYRPIDAEESAALDRELARAAALVDDGDVSLTPAGRALDDDAGVAALVEMASTDPELFVRARGLDSALEHGLISVDGMDADELAALSRRGAQRDGRTFSLWLVPATSWDQEGTT